MIFDVFTLTFNEQEILPAFLAHYAFARTIHLWDNESTDKTLEIAAADPRVVIHPYSTNGVMDDALHARLKNTIWWDSDADYVIVCDSDEFVDCRPLLDLPVQKVAFRCQGRQMVGPEPRYTPAPGYDKVAVFSPKILAINYGVGCHTADPPCEIIETPRLILRHYSMLSEESYRRRLRRPHPLSAKNREMRWGLNADYTDEQIRNLYATALATSVPDDGGPQ